MIRATGLSLLVSLFLSISIATASAQDASPATGYTPKSIALLNAARGMLLRTSPGVVIFVDSPKGRYHEAKGVSNVQTQAPLDANAQFEIGSNTKMMTAVIILQLVEEGKLKLDDPIGLTLLEETADNPDAGLITVKELLNHTSGLYDYMDDFGAAAAVNYERAGSDDALAYAWTPEQIVDYVWKYRSGNSYFKPGEPGQWHYSNTNYILLGLIIEKLTGKSYADNLQERIFDPLSMKNTLLLNDVPPAGSVSGYLAPPFDIDTTRWNLSQGWAAGGVVSSPSDMAVFIRSLLTGQLFKQSETLKLMKTTVPAPSFGVNYGLGLMDFGNDVWGNVGQTPGFESVVAYNEQDDLVLVAWTNCSTSGVNTLAFLTKDVE